MKIKYNNKEYNKIKDLLADTTIANIDKFLFNNKKITLSSFIKLQEKENKKDASGSASNSGDWGSGLMRIFLLTDEYVIKPNMHQIVKKDGE